MTHTDKLLIIIFMVAFPITITGMIVGWICGKTLRQWRKEKISYSELELKRLAYNISLNYAMKAICESNEQLFTKWNIDALEKAKLYSSHLEIWLEENKR